MEAVRVYWILLIFGIVFGDLCASRETSFVSRGKTKLKILGVFAYPGKSHFYVFQPLAEELARRGHEITVVSYYPRDDARRAKEPLPNYRDVNLFDPNSNASLFLDVVNLHDIDHSPFSIISELGMLHYMAAYSCNYALKSPRLLEFVKSNEKFDLIITEFFNTDCFLGFVHKFKAPFIAVSSHQILPWHSDLMGDPDESSYMPAILLGFTRPLNFFQRVYNTLVAPFMRMVYQIWFHPPAQTLATAVFGPELPDLRSIARNVTALMINTHSSLHGSRPHLPNVIEVGGLHIPSKTNPLPADIAKFLDDATEGVLYFNLGSMIKAASMPKEKLDIVLKVIGSIPRKVIWKWETDILTNKPANVLVKKWLPQFDILNHPNVRCYFGHGGLLGLSEGVYAGVPMILMPMYGDQFHNSAAAKTRGVAVVVEFTKMTEEILRNALDEVFNNTNYRENAKKLSKAYRDRPASPLETAVWWTEYIARGNGVPYLRSEGAAQTWYQRRLLDVYLFLIAVLLLLLYILRQLIKILVSSLRGSARKKDDRKHKKKE